MGVTIREMQIGDYEQVWEMWMQSKNMGFNDRDDSREGIDRLLRRNPGLSFVAEEEGKIAGVILAAQDGRRGYVYHMCVREDCRRRGIGARLARECLSAFREQGISKAALLVFKRNGAGNAFWEAQGFSLREDINYRNIALTELVRIDT